MTGEGAFAESVELDNARHYGNIGKPAVHPSSLVSKGGYLFETRFDPDAFTGDVVAREINSKGEITADGITDKGFVGQDNAYWRAHKALPDWDDRNIFTAVNSAIVNSIGAIPGGTGIEFLWNEFLPETVKNNLLPGKTNDELEVKGHIFVDWVRGSAVNEVGSDGVIDKTNNKIFRSRLKLNHEGFKVHYPLGDIIHSAVQYVGPPNKLISEASYAAFRTANKDRIPVVYVGANDGMLHAFDANDGKELFAFIPEAVHTNLEQHANPLSRAQEYYVDGTPTIGDAFGDFPNGSDGESAACDVDGYCWRTVLVGGLNSGGNSIYALDITDPENDKRSAQKMFLWEFSHADLGNSFSRPVIAQLQNKTWVAIFGNGIHDGGDANGALFIVDIANGKLLYKIDVGNAIPNGLLSPTAYDADFDNDVDFVYAGDSEGNLWKFDFSSLNEDNELDPTVYYVNENGDGLPLIQVNTNNGANNMIQTAPIVTTKPNGTMVVIFGTGIIFGEDNVETNFGDSLFGIEDRAGSDGYGTYTGLNDSNTLLVTYSLVCEQDGVEPAPCIDNRRVEKVLTPDDSVGWRVKLEDGERILPELTLTNNRVGFTSINLGGENARNWLNGVDYESGGAPDTAFLDIDGDLDIDHDDLVNVFIPVSVDIGHGIVSGPRIANVDDGLDVQLVTNGLKRDASFEEFDSPFDDPEPIGGHFDLDTFQYEGIAGGNRDQKKNNKKCWTRRDCHTHEYDDKLDVSGVSMLAADGDFKIPDDGKRERDDFGRKLCGKNPDEPQINDPNAICSDKHFSIKEVIKQLEKQPKDYGYEKKDDIKETEVYVNVINPYSVDTQALASLRADNNLDDNIIASPATIYFECTTGDDVNQIAADAPIFMGDNDNVAGKPASDSGVLYGLDDRKCKLGNITELIIHFWDINSMRATEPQCVKEAWTGPNTIGGEEILKYAGPNIKYGYFGNTNYRDTAIVVQLVRKIDSVILYENANYEHLKSEYLIDNENFAQDYGAKVECGGEANEYLRAFKDPMHTAFEANPGTPDSGGGTGEGGSGTGAGGGGGIVEANPLGEVLTKSVTTTGRAISSSRVSWREVLE
jgi:type IV pilus assembly protein PilY1